MKKQKRLTKVLLLILCISIGFAVLSTTIMVVGRATAKNPYWNVHLNNAQLLEGNVNEATINIVDANTLDFNTKFYSPSDYYIFSFDIMNEGKYDAMLGNIVMPSFTEEQTKLIDFQVTYDNGENLNVYDGIASGQTLTLHVKIKIKDGVTDKLFMETDLSNLDINLSLDFQTADANANFVIKTSS